MIRPLIWSGTSRIHRGRVAPAQGREPARSTRTAVAAGSMEHDLLLIRIDYPRNASFRPDSPGYEEGSP